MKIDEYDCVKIKRNAQVRISAETKDMTPEQLMAYYNQIGEGLRQQKAHLQSAAKNKTS